jgi:hypothetical protein
MWSRNYLPFRVICVHSSLMEGLVMLFLWFSVSSFEHCIVFHITSFLSANFSYTHIPSSRCGISQTLIYICSMLNSFSNKYIRWQSTKVVQSRKSNLGTMLLWKLCLSIGLWMPANICLYKYYIPMLNDQSFLYWRKLCR